jgi:phosphomannomutase
MKITNLKKLKPKDLIVFDLDGTLAQTKAPMDQEMAQLIEQLLTVKKVAIIGGGKYSLFKEQFLRELKIRKDLYKNLFLFPTTSTAFYRYDRGWKNVYLHELTKLERQKIKKTFESVFKEIGYQHPKKTYGKIIEDRGTQVTFSALGQDVVKVLGKKGIDLKERWKHEHTDTKLKIAKLMAKHLPDLEVRAAGHTSVDITKKGIDKAYGLQQIEKYVGVKVKDMLFIGDAIFPGGNDYAVVRTGVDYVPVFGPEDTKKVIHAVLS